MEVARVGEVLFIYTATSPNGINHFHVLEMLSQQMNTAAALAMEVHLHLMHSTRWMHHIIIFGIYASHTKQLNINLKKHII